MKHTSPIDLHNVYAYFLFSNVIDQVADIVQNNERKSDEKIDGIDDGCCYNQNTVFFNGFW